MGFYEQQLDPSVSYGVQGGPGYITLVTATPSRYEQRMSMQSRSYRKYRIDFNDKSREQMEEIRDFFMHVQGKLHGFRMKDWLDYKAVDEPITPVNNSGVYTAQLQKSYTKVGGTEVRPIRKPQTANVPVTLKRNGVSFASSGNWTLDTTTGIVTFTANQVGQTITWSGEFDTPVRFDFDDHSPEWDDFDVVNWDGLSIIEIPV